MKNFVLGMWAGISVAVCGYRPYQIEAEYRKNIAAGLSGLGTPSSPHCTVTIFKPNLLINGEPVEYIEFDGKK